MPEAWLEPGSWRTLSQVSVVATREPPGKIVAEAALGKTRPFDLYLSVPSQGGTAERNSIGADRQQTRTLVLDDPLPLHVTVATHGVVIETKFADVDTQELTFEIDGNRLVDISGSVRLRVVDADSGEVPPECTVELNGQPTSSGFHITHETSSAVPDPRGDVVFPRVTAGPVTLTIRADGYESIVQTVGVMPGEITDLGTFTLNRWRTILGRTLDAENKPVSVSVDVFPLERFESTRADLSNRCFLSNEGGELKIDGIGRGRYLLRIYDGMWGAPPLVVDTTNGTVRGLEIRLAPKVGVDLRFESTLPADALLRLKSDKNLPVLECPTTPGRVQHVRLLPGFYALHVTSGNEEVLSRALFVDTKASEVVIPGGR
jgi:hypothetical protein